MLVTHTEHIKGQEAQDSRPATAPRGTRTAGPADGRPLRSPRSCTEQSDRGPGRRHKSSDPRARGLAAAAVPHLHLQAPAWLQREPSSGVSLRGTPVLDRMLPGGLSVQAVLPEKCESPGPGIS